MEGLDWAGQGMVGQEPDPRRGTEGAALPPGATERPTRTAGRLCLRGATPLAGLERKNKGPLPARKELRGAKVPGRQAGRLPPPRRESTQRGPLLKAATAYLDPLC